MPVHCRKPSVQADLREQTKALIAKLLAVPDVELDEDEEDEQPGKALTFKIKNREALNAANPILDEIEDTCPDIRVHPPITRSMGWIIDFEIL